LQDSAAALLAHARNNGFREYDASQEIGINQALNPWQLCFFRCADHDVSSVADSEIDLAKCVKCRVDDRYDLLRVCNIEDRDTKAISVSLSNAEGFRTVATTLSPRSSESSAKIRPKPLLVPVISQSFATSELPFQIDDAVNEPLVRGFA
jgi:hypothetical protein